MEIYITQQLLSFACSALLGIMGALVYDLLRALRRLRGNALTHLLDGVYILLLGLTLLWLTLRVGEGELRGYMVGGSVAGGILYFAALSSLLRPIWDFWAGILVEIFRLIALPFRFCVKLLQKTWIKLKKSFHFIKKYAIIKKNKWEYPHLRSRNRGEGGCETHAKDKKNKKKKPESHPPCRTAGGADCRGGDRIDPTG